MDEYENSAAAPTAGCFWVPQLPPSSHPEFRGEKEPKNTRLLQQALPACKPVLDTLWVVFLYLSAGVVLIPIGAVCLAYGQKPVEVSARYDQSCFPINQTQVLPGSSNDVRQQYIWQNAADDVALSCSLTLYIEEDMPAPVYVFYEMDGLLQNHRRYVISRSDQQLVDKSDPDTSTCDAQLHYGGNESRVINPCGLTAWSFFNDTYQDWTLVRGGAAITQGPNLISTDGIAPSADEKYLFASYLPQWFNPVLDQNRGGGNISGMVQQDEHFIVWMRLAPLPKFRKLWGVIRNQNLRAGDRVLLTVLNRYNSYAYDGQKSIVLSTVTWLGTGNPFLGIVFLVTGCLAVTAGMVYMVVAVWVKPRRLGDVSVLSESEWPRQ